MKRIAFDLDDTVCVGRPYAESKPIPEKVKLINQLYDEGNHIIIFTARGMGSAKNQQEAINKYWYLTYNQLKNWGIKFHELIMGKPDYDILICDKAVNSNQILNKEDIYNFLGSKK